MQQTSTLTFLMLIISQFQFYGKICKHVHGSIYRKELCPDGWEDGGLGHCYTFLDWRDTFENAQIMWVSGLMNEDREHNAGKHHF